VNDVSKGNVFSNPSFQPMLAPRFANMNVGANIRYNPPQMANMAAPCNPLDMGDMVNEGYKQPTQQPQRRPQQTKENYCGSSSGCGGGGSVSCGTGGYGMGHMANDQMATPPGYVNGQDSYNAQFADVPASTMTGSLPMGTMSISDGLGNADQSVVVINELMYASSPKNRLTGLGCQVRGDLPINLCASGWFSVSPNPEISLMKGYMGVAGGVNALDEGMVSMLTRASGGTQTVFGGVDLSSPEHSQQLRVSMPGVASSLAGDANYTVTGFM
jgi:hypothetical protein